jgi:hypothetical protein
MAFEFMKNCSLADDMRFRKFDDVTAKLTEYGHEVITQFGNLKFLEVASGLYALLAILHLLLLPEEVT